MSRHRRVTAWLDAVRLFNLWMTAPMIRPALLAALLAAAFVPAYLPAFGAPVLIARGSLSGLSIDSSGQTQTLENGVRANLLGGVGSGLAWAGGNTFLALPDRGPNAVAWNSGVADTSSYIPRLQVMTLDLSAMPSGGLPFTLTPTLRGTTLLYATDSLNYGAAPSLVSGGRNYFTGRSDAFDPTASSANPLNARFDAEGIRVSADGLSVYVSDEYGPYIYQFDRFTGKRIRAIALPANLAVAHPGPTTASEGASTNSSGRVGNKGMEGLAISPDGKTLIGFMQSPLLQDGGDGGQYNRIVTVDIASGATHEYTYNNRVGGRNFNSSELLALNSHEFLVLERDGKGLGDGSQAVFKQILKFNIAGAADVTALSGAASLAPKAISPTLFLDLKAALVGAGIDINHIPAKLEGMAFGQDVLVAGVLKHTLFVANDNDFLATTAVFGGTSLEPNPNQWYVFAFDAADLGGSSFVNQNVAVIPEPATWALVLGGLTAAGGLRRRRPVR